MTGVHHARARSRSAGGGEPLRRRRRPRGQLPLTVALPPAELVLGVDGAGAATAFSLLTPYGSTRVGMVGELWLAQLLALRLLGQGCDLTVVTDRTRDWERLAAAEPDASLAIAELDSWPAHGTAAPWALIVDLADPPGPNVNAVPWSTVVHVVAAAPPGGQWWQALDLMLTTGAHFRTLNAQGPRLDVAAAQRLTHDDLVAVDHRGVTVFRPSLRRDEQALLTRP